METLVNVQLDLHCGFLCFSFVSDLKHLFGFFSMGSRMFSADISAEEPSTYRSRILLREAQARILMHVLYKAQNYDGTDE